MKNNIIRKTISILITSSMLVAGSLCCFAQTPAAPADTTTPPATESEVVQQAVALASSEADATKDKVASESEMAPAEDVGSDNMVPVYGSQIKNGEYDIEVESSSSMFRIVAARLTVKDGEMSAVITLSGKGYGKLFMGTAEKAATASEEECIPFVENAEGQYTYTVPVEALDKVVSCAAWSLRKEMWYDRDLVFSSEGISSDSIDRSATAVNVSEGLAKTTAPDGNYQVDVILDGGTGRASVTSPAELNVTDGNAVLTIEWSSSNYDYMIVAGSRYEPVNDVGNSVFLIPVMGNFGEPFAVTADTTAMSIPHEIEYTLTVSDPAEQVAETEAALAEKSEKGNISTTAIIVIAILVIIAVIAGVFVGVRLGRRKKADK